MLSEAEKRILKLMSEKLLITKAELIMSLEKEKHNGAEMSIQRLKNMGYIDKVESLGNCLVLTQQGQRALREP